VQVDRNLGFRWFAKLMSEIEENDLEKSIRQDFFENKVLRVDARLLNEAGMKH